MHKYIYSGREFVETSLQIRTKMRYGKDLRHFINEYGTDELMRRFAV